MNLEFPRNEHLVNAAVQVSGTMGVLLDDDVARRKGPLNRIDDDWRQTVRKRMGELGISAAELARLTGASKGHISEVLSLEKKKATSRWVDAIHHVLKLETRGGFVVAVASGANAHAAPPAADSERGATGATGGIAALDATGKRELAHQIVERLSDDALDSALAYFLGLRR